MHVFARCGADATTTAGYLNNTISGIMSFAHKQFRYFCYLTLVSVCPFPLFCKTLPIQTKKVNMIMATMLGAVAEGMCLSESLGLNNEALIEVITIEPCHGI